MNGSELVKENSCFRRRVTGGRACSCVSGRSGVCFRIFYIAWLLVGLYRLDVERKVREWRGCVLISFTTDLT